MKSSTGAHYIALDHVRALAIWLVVTWHFTHGENGFPNPFSAVPGFFPLAIFDEGHTGVALFMTLSGYLFAKLLEGKAIHYSAFLWNRMLRLLPLLVVVIGLVGLKKYLGGENLEVYAQAIALGLWWPTLPNGGWSIIVETHYYALLPLLLWLLKKNRWWLVAVVLAAIGLRFGLHAAQGEIQSLAYWTLVGRIDQFVLGMLFYQLRGYLTHRHGMVALILLAFTAFYWLFDTQGGFYQRPFYPSPARLWVVLPTLEGLVYAMGIAWYDSSFTPPTTGVSQWVGRLGEYSYSIYLLHYFFVFEAARFVHERIMDLSNFYLASGWALLFVILMMIPGYLSFRFLEMPFLKLRKRYLKAAPSPQPAAEAPA